MPTLASKPAQLLRLALALTGLTAVLLLQAPGARADVVVPDDQIVQGSQCLGFDCINNESFGFDTLRLKENNTRLAFDDTSLSAGFAANDWALVANANSSGGDNYLAFQDITASGGATDGPNAVFPLLVRAGAPTNSLYVAPNGRVGIGTPTPGSSLAVAGSLAQQIDPAALQAVQAVDSAQLLASLTKLPLNSWAYNADPSLRHLGPTAQDFNAAFGLGAKDGYVAPADLSGVALAASKALAVSDQAQTKALQADAAKLQSHETRLQATEATVAGLAKQNKKLKKRLAKLAKKVAQLSS
jgi:hypothetical protein